MKLKLLLASFFLLPACTEEPVNCSQHLIVRVGGCDKSGNCAVLLENGIPALVWANDLPVEGHFLTFCRSSDGSYFSRGEK